MALGSRIKILIVIVVCMVFQGTRLLRALLERVRCMLDSVVLKKVFWVEVVVIAVYLINRCSSISLRMKTLEEVCSGHPPDLDKLRLFGCVVHAHIK